ncbi:MAG: metal ABC transporter permease [Verrucomicrobiales bacterium]
MLWPILGCLLLPPMLVYLGLHIIEREIIFVDLALAQVAALGACMAILLDHHGDWRGYAWSFGFTIVGAAIFTLTRIPSKKVPQEALIGIVYVVAAAAAVLLLSRSAEGDEELRRLLVGEILLVNAKSVLQTFALFAGVGVLHYLFRKPFQALSFHHNHLPPGFNAKAWDFLFYTLFGILVTTFVQIAGVLLTFSFLIVPAVFGKFVANSLLTRLATGWVVATGASLAGLYGSYKFDFPTGAALVCALGASLLLVPFILKVKQFSNIGDKP